jgi:hypothetical protein
MYIKYYDPTRLFIQRKKIGQLAGPEHHLSFINNDLLFSTESNVVLQKCSAGQQKNPLEAATMMIGAAESLANLVI